MFGMQHARAITSKAYSNLAHRDPYHLRRAEKTFGKPVAFESFDSHVLRIKTKLEGLLLNQNVLAATCDFKECNDGTHNFVAVTTNDLNQFCCARSSSCRRAQRAPPHSFTKRDTWLTSTFTGSPGKKSIAEATT